MDLKVKDQIDFLLNLWKKSIHYEFSTSKFITYDPTEDPKYWISSTDTVRIGKLIVKLVKEENIDLGGTFVHYLIQISNNLSNDEIFEQICQLMYLQFKQNAFILSPLACKSDYLNDEMFVHPKNKTLYNHQKNMIDFLYKEEITSEFDVKYLTDKVGTGKTYMAISLCYHKNNEGLNLIIVPNHLLYHWKYALEEYEQESVTIMQLRQFRTIMKAIANSKKKCTLSSKPVKLEKLKIICISSLLYKRIKFEYSEKSFKRIIVDENTNLSIVNQYDYLYILSATNLVPIEIPEYFTEKSQVENFVKTKIYINNQILELPILNSLYDLDSLFYNLNDDSSNFNNNNVMEIFLKKYLNMDYTNQKKLNTLADCVEFLKVKLENYDQTAALMGFRDHVKCPEYVQTKNEYEECVQKKESLQRVISENINTIEHIKSKILAKECVICLKSLECVEDGNEQKLDYLVTSCCHNATCIECNYENEKLKKGCAFCRCDPYLCIPFLNKTQLNKHETILSSIKKIISKNPIAKILICSRDATNFNIVKDNFSDICITLIGRPDCFNKYKEINTCKILLVYMNRFMNEYIGVDLSCTTNVLILSDLRREPTEEKIIGQCYRNGITHDLFIERILYENETDLKSGSEIYNYTDVFKSTELKPISRFFNLGDFVEKNSYFKFKEFATQSSLKPSKYRNKENISNKRLKNYMYS